MKFTNPPSPWNLWDAVIAGVYLLAFAGAGLLAILHPPAASKAFPGLVPLLPALILNPLVAVSLLLARKVISGAPFSAFFGKEKTGLAILCGAGCGILLFLGMGLLGRLIEFFADRVLHYTPQMQDLVQWLLSADTPVSAKTVLCLHAALFAPVSEEILFRGALLSPFVKRGRWTLGAFITATFFALCHGNALALLPMFLVGWFLAFYGAMEGAALLFCIAAHVAFNLLNLAIIFLFPSLAL